MQQLPVYGKYVQQIQMLALVLVQALYLDVEHRVRIEGYPAGAHYNVGQAHLVVPLDGVVLCLEGFI